MSEQSVILLTNSLGNGGAERVVSILLAQFRAEHRPVHLVCLEHNDFYALPEGVQVHYLSSLTGQEPGWKKLLYLPIFAWRLRRLVRQLNASLVQSHVYRANYVNALARWFGSRHRVQLVNVGQVSLYQQEGWLGKINLWLIRHLYPVAELLILKSYGMQADLRTLMPQLSVRQQVIHNPYDVTFIQQQAQLPPSDWKADGKKFTLVSVGRLISLKQVDEMIHALARLPAQVELLLVGDGGEKDYLKGLAKAQGVDERVIFVGRQENPFSYVSRADAFVMMSRSEGFPNVLVEALLCGVPCIAADCVSGPREILAPTTPLTQQLSVGDGVEWATYGALIAVHDVAALVEAVQQLMAQPELRQQYVQQGQQRGYTFRQEVIVAQYAQVMWLEDKQT